MKNKLKPITRRQRIFYDGLVAFQKEKGYTPALHEMGVKSPQLAQFYCQKLFEAGYVTRVDRHYIPVDLEMVQS